MDLRDFLFLGCAVVALACLLWIGFDDSLANQKTACMVLAGDAVFFIIADLFLPNERKKK